MKYKNEQGKEITEEEFNKSPLVNAGEDEDGYHRLCPNGVNQNNNGGWAGPCYGCPFNEEYQCTFNI